MTGRLWAAVGKWRDADLCFEALKAATHLVSEELDYTEYVPRARRLTANWENKSNAQRVIDAFQKLTDDIEEQQYEEQQYDESPNDDNLSVDLGGQWSLGEMLGDIDSE